MKKEGAHHCRYKVGSGRFNKSRKKRAARKEAAKGNDYALSLNPLDGHRPVYRRTEYSAEIIQLGEALAKLVYFFFIVWVLHQVFGDWPNHLIF